MRILGIICGTIGALVLLAVLAMIATAAYTDLTDPRPRGGTPECEAAQIKIFSREPDPNQTPAEFMKEVNDVCKP